MYKRLILFFMAFIFFLSYNSKQALGDEAQTIRVGLEYKYKNVQSIGISDTSIIFGSESNNIFNSEVTLNSNSGFTMKTTNIYYVSTGNIYTTYEQALSQAYNLSSFGVKATPAYLNLSNWGVYYGGYTSLNEATSEAQRLGGQVISPNNKMTELLDGQNQIIICDNSYVYPQISTLSNIVTLSDRSYRGRIEFNRTQGGITAINVINIEDYLYGVVPSEIIATWPIEAVKAQAVAARTYTSRTHKHLSQGYDLCDNIHCQSYLGYNNENVSSNQAVDQTRGQKIYYNGELIDAIYFSSSGGYTDDSENVWDNVFPYLRAVPDNYEKSNNPWTRTVTLNQLTSYANQKGFNIGSVINLRVDEYTQGGRVKKLTIVGSNGSKTLQKEDIKNFFSPSLDSNFFRINESITANTDSSYQNNSNYNYNDTTFAGDTITIQGSNSRITKDVDSIGIKGDSNSIKMIDSNSYMYVLGNTSQMTTYSMRNQPLSNPNLNQNQSYTTIPANPSSSDTFIINGKGNGHGVGMSQFGAKGMAESGFSYLDILKHYYTNVTIQ